jgi:hypothetical protein
MKASVRIVLAIALMALLSGTALASDWKDLCCDKYATVEKNLLIGLQSDNQGLRESAAYMLGEIGSTRAVVYLMDMLHNSPEESSRIVAALALCRIGDARGTYAVRRATSFDPSESVQKKAAWFYNEYVQPGSFGFAAATGTTAGELATR